MPPAPTMEIFAVGHAAPLDVRLAFASDSAATGGLVDLPNQRFFFRLMDYTEADAQAFADEAKMRVARLKTCLLLSPAFGKLNFDVIWSPLIGAAANEPPMEKPGPEDHLLFTFILLDGDMTVRAIRAATISPLTVLAIWRAKNELSQEKMTAEDVLHEVGALFRQFPRSVPDCIFHEVCDLGD